MSILSKRLVFGLTAAVSFLIGGLAFADSDNGDLDSYEVRTIKHMVDFHKENAKAQAFDYLKTDIYRRSRAIRALINIDHPYSTEALADLIWYRDSSDDAVEELGRRAAESEVAETAVIDYLQKYPLDPGNAQFILSLTECGTDLCIQKFLEIFSENKEQILKNSWLTEYYGLAMFRSGHPKLKSLHMALVLEYLEENRSELKYFFDSLEKVGKMNRVDEYPIIATEVLNALESLSQNPFSAILQDNANSALSQFHVEQLRLNAVK